MADPMYSSDLFIDGLTIKSEPMTIDSLVCSNTSASVPIPSRRLIDFSELRDGFDLNEVSPCSSSFQDTNLIGSSLYSASVWSPKSDMKMEDDDIFQVDKADLIQGPTLAELNANDETLLDDLSFDDLLLPEDASSYIQVPVSSKLLNGQQFLQTSNVAMSFPPDGAGFYRDFATINRRADLSPRSPHSSTSSLLQSASPPLPDAVSPVPPQQPSTLHDLLKLSPSPQPPFGQSVPGRHNTGGSSGGSSSGGATKRPHLSSRLSSSAPTHSALEMWQRREPRPHLLSTGSLAEGTSTSSLSTAGVLSPESHDFSLEECFDSEDDSEHEEDFSSDAGSDSDGEGAGSSSSKAAKKERFFWQYNVQAKGPKGQRLVIKTKLEDPHRLNQVTDPVFSPQCSVQGIKHSGKARKGDGNDLTPNPRKLHSIGKELDKLNRVINDMTPVSELPYSARPNTRKEKNKLASRACRLKKKAQHEANKIKLHGLELEHRRLMNGIQQMKNLLISRASANPPDPVECKTTSEKIVKSATKVKIAGQSTEFVNKILEKVKAGVSNGGLDDMS